MPNQTITIIKRVSPLSWVLIGVALILLILMYKGCRNERAKDAQVAAFQAEINQRDSTIADMRRIFADRDKHNDSAKVELTNQRMAIHKKLDSVSKKLATQLQSNRTLIAQRDMFRDALPDSTWIKVHPGYVGQCQDCFDKLEITTAQVEGYRLEDSAKDQILAHELSIRDAEIDSLKIARNRALDKAWVSNQAAKDILKKMQPTRRVYLAASAGWTPLGIQAGGGFTYAGKKSTMVTGQVMWQKGWGGQITIHQLLSFKRKR